MAVWVVRKDDPFFYPYIFTSFTNSCPIDSFTIFRISLWAILNSCLHMEDEIFTCNVPCSNQIFSVCFATGFPIKDSQSWDKLLNFYLLQQSVLTQE